LEQLVQLAAILGSAKKFVKLKEKERKKDSIPWGTIFQEAIPDEDIIQTAWKDQAMVLILSTVYTNNNQTIERNCRRPKAISTSAKILHQPFGDCSRKMLAIPVIVDTTLLYGGC